MCLIAWHWQPTSSTPLVLIGNRDEFYARPTQALHWWGGNQLLAGKDLQGGGTWLGLGRNGRLAAITNYRDPSDVRLNTPSRGELVAQFLQSPLSAVDYLAQLAPRAGHYNPFNLLVMDGHALMGLESRSGNTLVMQPGFGAVSNAGFNTPWPKLTRLKQGLQAHVAAGTADNATLLQLLQDPTLAPDDDLPATGIALELERALSAAFIATPAYGTRACSVVRVHDKSAEFVEVGHSPSGQSEAVRFVFDLQP